MDFTRDQEITYTSMLRPHVVLVGAGASRAALPNGDANGKFLPLMKDLIGIVELEDMLKPTGITTKGRDFEEIYADIHNNNKLTPVSKKIESRIYDYFDCLVLPDRPTVYDYLVLSLRDKDVIATFNWDPFLVQACRRNRWIGSLPRLFFLHGNVKIACCVDDKVVGLKGSCCSKCGQRLEPTRLLYPVTEKNYEADPMLSAQWQHLRDDMSSAFMFTVFGYSAPKTDIEAIGLLKKGWGPAEQRSMEETEIIDIKEESELVKVWKPFLYSDHYSVSTDFFNSVLARHPRRTGEIYMAQIINGLCAEGNPVPKDSSFSELKVWFQQLRDAESTRR